MANTSLNEILQDEIIRLSSENYYEAKILEDFAIFVIENHKKKSKKASTAKGPSSQKSTAARAKTPKVKKLTATEIKQAIYRHFNVSTTPELKKSGGFKLATDGMENINLSNKESLERLYRKFIGILPGEEGEEGYGCINGINIFEYDLPWKVFNLDPTTASTEDVKASYRNLSKIYHPDNSETGDARIFDRLTVFYKSLTERF